jgi:O-antigen ligase
LVFLLPPLLNAKNLKIVLQILFWTSFFLCCFGIYQFIGDFIGLPTGLKDIYTKEIFDFPRIQATFSEPLYFANFMLFPLGIFLSFFLSNPTALFKKLKISRLKLSLFLILALINFTLTLSRGAYLAFFVLILILGAFNLKKIIRVRFFMPILAFILLIVFSGIFLLYYFDTSVNLSFLKDFFDQATNFSQGAGVWEREETLKSALLLIPRHPFLGWGPGSFGPLVSSSEFIPPLKPKIGWPIVNNEPLELILEHGILGFSLLSLFFLFLLLKIWRTIQLEKDVFLKSLNLGLLAALLACLIQYQTFSTLYILYFWFFVALSLALQKLKSH